MGVKQNQPQNNSNTIINFATEESLMLLRRIVKLLESNGVVDSLGRQRISLDAYSGNAATNYPLWTKTYNTTWASSFSITFGPPSVPNAIATATSAVDGSWLLVDVSRYTYANGIRNALQWE